MRGVGGSMITETKRVEVFGDTLHYYGWKYAARCPHYASTMHINLNSLVVPGLEGAP